MKTNKVVFVGGTAYSGSTVLDMMIASGEEGFSAGEVYALYYPYRPYHINPQCGCGDISCDVWKKIKKAGVQNIYKEIFNNFPKVKCIVDSSKRPIWIARQTEIVQKMGFDVKNILIYKNPYEYAMSRKKRGKLEGWLTTWKNYHKLYFSLNDQWIAVRCSMLTKNPSKVLEILCENLNLEYFQGKEKYWNFSHHTLFGSNTAKRHLYSKDTNKYKNLLLTNKEKNEKPGINQYRTIYSEDVIDNVFKDKISQQVSQDKDAQAILKFLEEKEIVLKNNVKVIAQIDKTLNFNWYYLFLYKNRDILKRFISKTYAIRKRNATKLPKV